MSLLISSPINKHQIQFDQQPVSDYIRGCLRKTAGSGCWLSKSTRPDLSFEVSYIQQDIEQATYETVKFANNMVRRAQDIKYEILISGIDLSSPTVLVVSDASPGKMPRSGSQGGCFQFLTSKSIVDSMTNVALLCWSSHRLKRVARSSLATEGMALCEATEQGEFIRACLAEAIVPSFHYKQWEEAAKLIQMIVCVDAKSVYDHITAERGLPSDKMLALDLAALKHTFESQLREDSEQRNAVLRWIPGPRNVADGLTKYLAVQDILISTMTSGKYTIADDDMIMARAAALKSLARERGKARKQQNKNSVQVNGSVAVGSGDGGDEVDVDKSVVVSDDTAQKT